MTIYNRAYIFFDIMISYEKLEESLHHLESQYRHFQTMESGMEIWLQEALKESVIQRFETCYDTLFKLLKRYLIEDIGIADVPTGPKPLIRIAAQNTLLPSSSDVWIRYVTTPSPEATTPPTALQTPRETVDLVQFESQAHSSPSPIAVTRGKTNTPLLTTPHPRFAHDPQQVLPKILWEYRTHSTDPHPNSKIAGCAGESKFDLGSG